MYVFIYCEARISSDESRSHLCSLPPWPTQQRKAGCRQGQESVGNQSANGSFQPHVCDDTLHFPVLFNRAVVRIDSTETLKEWFKSQGRVQNQRAAEGPGFSCGAPSFRSGEVESGQNLEAASFRVQQKEERGADGEPTGQYFCKKPFLCKSTGRR